MNLLFQRLSYLVALFCATSLYAQTQPIVCNQMYALCTSARCIPLADSPGKAMCECITEKGLSAGFTSCDKRKPKHDKYNTLLLVSTFSFNEFKTKKAMNCAKGMPWSNCVDMPCSVDPQDSKRALCTCTINNTEAFFTFGGSCNTDSCSTGFWSGATDKDAERLRTSLSVIKTPINTTPANCLPADKDTK